MEKARITVSVTVEYNMVREHYPEGLTLQEMLELDMDGANSDPLSFMDNSYATWVVSGELV